MKIVPSYGPARNPRTRVTAWVCAGLLVVMLVSQLFSYEDFASTLNILLPINEQPLIHLIAALAVVVELLALPYLLAMYLSRLLRVVSGSFAALAATFWLIVALTNAHAANSGLFSTTFVLPGGILAAIWTFVLFGTLAAVIYTDSKFRHDTSTP